jgi:proteasomal ATPase-associated factor 1
MSTTNPNLTVLPMITIDPTFSTVIRDVQAGDIPAEKFWVSCYKTSENSQHAKIRLQLDESDRDRVIFKPEEADVKFESNDDYTVRNFTLSF